MIVTAGQLRQWLESVHDDAQVVFSDPNMERLEVVEAWPSSDGYQYHVTLAVKQ